MKSEYYNLEIVYKGKIRQIPVTIDVRSVGNKISAVVDGVKITFRQDDQRDGLRPTSDSDELDPELCHLIGSAICKAHRLHYLP